MIISVVVGLQYFGNFFDEVAANHFDDNAAHPKPIYIQKQDDLCNELFDNRENRDYFYAKIKQTDVYKAFVAKYPDSTLTQKFGNNFFMVHDLYHAYSEGESLAAIVIFFEIFLNDGHVDAGHQCIGKGSDSIQSDMPTLLWLETDRCSNAVNNKVDFHPDDSEIFHETLLYAYNVLKFMADDNYILYDRIVPSNVQLNDNILLVEIDATETQNPVLQDILLDVILRKLDAGVPITLEITSWIFFMIYNSVLFYNAN